MADMINEFAEAAQEAGLETTVLEAAADTAKKFDWKTFFGGTLAGATLAVIGGKAIDAIKDSKNEIKELNDKAKKEKLDKEIEKQEKRLQALIDKKAGKAADQDVVESEVVEDETE